MEETQRQVAASLNLHLCRNLRRERSQVEVRGRSPARSLAKRSKEIQGYLARPLQISLRAVPAKHARTGRRLPSCSACLRVEGRHMRFILVNGRTLSRRTFCMLCSRPIGASYLKELRTGLPFCGHDCYALYCDRWVARVSHPTCSTVAPNPRSSARAKASCQLGPPSVADKKPVHRPVKPGDPS